MARVAAQKTALPINHPLHRPLKKRQAEACQRVHALWGVWPWELIIPVATYDGRAAISNRPTSHYQLEHPPDWSDNILDTLRKLALSTTLEHAIARIGYHAALIKVSRLSVRLTKAVTTECEIAREHTPPNPKAGSGPIVNRRNKKTAMQRRLSQDASMDGLSRQSTCSETSASPRSSSPQSEPGAMSPEARDHYSRACSDMRQRTALPQFGSSQLRGNDREWPGPLALPKLQEAGQTQQSMYGSDGDSMSFSPTSTGLITPLSEDVNSSGLPVRVANSYHHHLSSQGSNEDPRKRNTSPTLREATQGLSNVSISRLAADHPQHVTAHATRKVLSHSHILLNPEEHSKRQKRATLPSFVELPVPRVQLTPPTSPTESTGFPSMTNPKTSSSSQARYSPSAFDTAMAGVRAIQKANNCPLSKHDGYLAQRVPQPSHHAHFRASEQRQVTLPPIMSPGSSHQRHSSYHTHPTQAPSARPSFQRQHSGSRLPPISLAATSTARPALSARSFSSHHQFPYDAVYSSSSSYMGSGSRSETTTPPSSGPETAPPAADQRMKMSFLM